MNNRLTFRQVEPGKWHMYLNRKRIEGLYIIEVEDFPAPSTFTAHFNYMTEYMTTWYSIPPANFHTLKQAKWCLVKYFNRVENIRSIDKYNDDRLKSKTDGY